MDTQDVVFYSSENGDQWLIVGGGGGSIVRHRPNVSSGGQSRDLDLREFLSREANTPQGRALQQRREAQV